MVRRSRLCLILFIICISVGVLYSSYSLVDSISGEQSSSKPSGMNQSIRTINTGNLKFFNRGEDENLIGDFFEGLYYDSAYGIFNMSYVSSKKVHIKQNVGSCGDSTKKYTLSGLAYNSDFGVVNFSNEAGKSQIFVCVNDDQTSPNYGQARFEGYVFSPYIGVQDFTGISFEAITNLETKQEDEDGILGRYTKVDGIASSSNNELTSEFDDEVRVLGKMEKSSIKKNISRNVYRVIQNVEINNGSNIVTSIDKATWKNSLHGTKLQNNKILYFGDLQGRNVTISGNVVGNKTLIVEGGNVHITGHIRGEGILGIIVLKKDRADNGQGNVYIDPSVTDVHASIYADGSILNYKDNIELGGNTVASQLANQLFIKGSVFTENTLGGGTEAPYTCPYFIKNNVCNRDIARKYDLNYIRRYRLVESFADNGNSLGKRPDYSGTESFIGDTNRDNNDEEYRKFPLIIQYDSRIQSSPPPLF